MRWQDLLVAVLYPTLTTVVSLVFDKQFNGVLVYLWIISILAFGVLFIGYIKSYVNRSAEANYGNEEEALPKTKELISKTENRLLILSKVGTTVFFAFEEYSDLLEKGKEIQVLTANPYDPILIETMNKLYIKGTGKVNEWQKLLIKIRDGVNALNKKGLIDKRQHMKLMKLTRAKSRLSQSYPYIQRIVEISVGQSK